MKIRVLMFSLLFILSSGLVLAQADSTKSANDSIPKKQVMKKGNTNKLKEQSYYPSLVKRVESELKTKRIQLKEAKKRVSNLESSIEKTEDRLDQLKLKAKDAKSREKMNKMDYSTTRNKRDRFSKHNIDVQMNNDEDVQSLKRELRELRKEIKELKEELKKK